MLTDMAPSAAGQFYGSQIPAMGITNIAPHIQKTVSNQVHSLHIVKHNKIILLLRTVIIWSHLAIIIPFDGQWQHIVCVVFIMSSSFLLLFLLSRHQLAWPTINKNSLLVNDLSEISWCSSGTTSNNNKNNSDVPFQKSAQKSSNSTAGTLSLLDIWYKSVNH